MIFTKSTRLRSKDFALSSVKIILLRQAVFAQHVKPLEMLSGTVPVTELTCTVVPGL
jgi:hypothetical protein